MSATDDEIISRFPIGYHQLHSNISLNFQMNRFYNWVGEEEMLDEMKAASARIFSYEDWTREMLNLSDEALAAGRNFAAAYYSRGAQFFLEPDDPRFKPALQRFMDNVEAHSGITPNNTYAVPYQEGQLSAYRFTPERPRGTIVVFGGYDSYIAEWLPAAIALRDAGMDTVIFDGPGQGTALDAGMPMTPDWHLPVAAVLDYFDLSDVTLMGFSLGGCLVMRAAAREPRVSRVIAWDVFTDLFESSTRGFGAVGLDNISAYSESIPDEVVNAAVEAVAGADLLTQWVFSQGERVMAASTPANVFRAWRDYTTGDVSPQITQDVLLMAGTKDHYVPLHMFGDQVLTLSAARSVSARVFTETEQAQNHCQIGNQGLAIKVIFDWLDAVGGRKAEPANQ
ncbi:alpha/beta hydrolase [Streptomyces sp. NPDC048663]|uniref:alpha/beta hydrolase n=1 Tax=Streptomyces sp. NPDC048663 TaxID=3155638 RepID=UPI003430DA3B